MTELNSNHFQILVFHRIYSSTTANSKKSTKEPDFRPVINKLHTVYVAMGKRSVRDTSLSFDEKFYLEHHRNTRHKLYEIVEKYLFALV